MNEENNLSAFANDYRSFTTIQPVSDCRSLQPTSADMADVGTLSFNRPKSSPTARPMPDGSFIAFFAPLQTVLGIPPESRWNLLSATNSLFWHDVTDSGSARFTWQNALLNRATNAPLSFQAELFPDGDFIYRYDFGSLTPSTLPLAPNFVIGAQNNGGGETALISTGDYHCTATNHLCASLFSLDGTNVVTTPLCSVITNSPKFSLRWTALGDYNPSDPDPDDDGITTVDEVLIHHTDPNKPDSDLDGISDGDEIASGTNPLNPDGDDDGIPDGQDSQPFVWNDASTDSDGDGLSLAEELLYGLDPAVGNNVDTDGDGWEDWKEVLAGTSPTDYGDNPGNGDGSAKIFDVTFTLESSSGTPLLIAVGGYRMVFGASGTSRTLTLREGIAYPVLLYVPTAYSADITAVIDSDFAIFQNPHPAFTGGGTLSGGRTASSGMIAQPVPSTDPERICFHSTDDKQVEALVSPDMPGNWSWGLGCEPWGGTESEVNLSYDDSPTWIIFHFLANGAASSRSIWRDITRCTLLEEHPEWLTEGQGEPRWDPPFDQYHEGDPVNGEPMLQGPDPETDRDAALAAGLLVPVNNDDDDGSASTDSGDTHMAIADNDLVIYYPLGYFTGQCCPCPEHKYRYALSGTFASASTRLVLYSDASKSNAFTGTIHAGEPLYVEGLSKSSTVGADKIIWEYTDDDDQTHQLTNTITMLSQRIFADLDCDGDVDADDKATHASLDPVFGWVITTAPSEKRKVQLRTDVGLPGLHVLSLSGNEFCRVWQTASPDPEDVPLLVSGQSVTNGVDGVSWEIASSDHVYIQSVSNGTAILTYAFIGTGIASGVVSRASLKTTVLFDVSINGDYNRNGSPIDHLNEADSVTFAGPKGFVILANHDDDNGDGVSDGEKNPATDLMPNVYTINGPEDVPDIYELHVEKLGISASSIPSTWSLEIKVLDPATEASTQAAIIYPNRNAGTQGGTTLNFSGTSLGSIFGGTGNATVLGIEGRGYGKEVIVRMTLKDGAEAICSDEIRILVAPFMVLSNVDKTVRVYTGSDSLWPTFHVGLTSALSGVVPVESIGSMNFLQDYGEIGYTRTPPGVVADKRTIIAGLGGIWFEDKIDSTTAYFFLGGGDGGSIEASPAITGYPYGRIIVGDQLGVTCKAFLKEQEVQTNNGNLIELPVGWLQVKHADEVFSIVSWGSGFKVLVADFQLAIDLLRNKPTEETSGGFDTRATLLGRYDDPANASVVANINTQLAAVRSTLSSGLSIPESQFIKVPVAFSIDTPSEYYLPNMVNMLVVKNASGIRKLVIPKPFFDPFLDDLSGKLTTAGYGVEEKYWLDTREPHTYKGEVHCTTNARRESP